MNGHGNSIRVEKEHLLKGEQLQHSVSISLKLAREQLGKMVTVTIDRPLGTKHPKHDYVYPINYGYIEGVRAPDGEDLDAYVVGVDVPIETFEGICVAIVHRHDDDDDKLIVVSENRVDISDAEILEKVHFQEQWFNSVIVRK